MKMKRVAGAAFGAALVAAGYYLVSPLFRVTRLDEPAPTRALPEADTAPVGAPVVGSVGHPASGTARVVEADGRTYVRYENFKTINGPDIYVYLAKDLGANDFVSLGRVKATEGNVNYEVPAGVDVAEYPYVLTWCRAFGVLFNHAVLQ